MLFSSPNGQRRMVVIPKDYEIVAGHKRLVRGLDAQFEDHSFDSRLAQKRNRWTDEQRLEVEQFLLESEDFGRPGGIYLADVPDFKPEPQVQADGSVVGEIDSRAHGSDDACIVTFATPFGAQRCVNKRLGDTMFCASHQAYKAEVPEEAGVGAEH